MHIFQSSFFRSSKKCSLYTNRGCFIVDSHTGTAMLPTAIPLPTSTKFQASGYVTENILDSVGKIWLPIIATWTCHTAMEGHFFFGTSFTLSIFQSSNNMESASSHPLKFGEGIPAETPALRKPRTKMVKSNWSLRRSPNPRPSDTFNPWIESEEITQNISQHSFPLRMHRKFQQLLLPWQHEFTDNQWHEQKMHWHSPIRPILRASTDLTSNFLQADMCLVNLAWEQETRNQQVSKLFEIQIFTNKRSFLVDTYRL